MYVNFETPLTTRAVQAELLDYIQQHPDAADTAEGIRQWWLIRRIAAYSRDIIQASLDQMVASHALKKQSTRDGEVIYQINKQ